MGVINVSLFKEAQHHCPDTSDGNYSQRHSSRLNCSLPPIGEPLHFLINSNSKGKKQHSDTWPFRTNKPSQQLQAESRAAWKEALCHSERQFLVYYAASVLL